MGIGSVTFSLPHFLSDNYMVHSDSNTTSDNICKISTPLTQPHNQLDNGLLEQLPGLDKIKSLTEGKAPLRSFPENSR